ncbi:hypothetical protein FXO37_28217 [Capsicum annuum]|nr:hypothetical protein FXO37_28217 [Capsicum annuum]
MGSMKTVQVADMHYGNGMLTRCRDVLESEFNCCTDLNTTQFLRKIIEIEKPDLIVFTVSNFYSYSRTWLRINLNASMFASLEKIILPDNFRNELRGHIDGSDPAPTDPTKPYKNAKAMWDYLQKVYYQDNSAVHEQSKRDQFLIKLRSKFDSIRSHLMNRDPSPSLDVCFRELLREELRFVTQNTFKQIDDIVVAFVTQGKGKGTDMTRTQCYSCKEYGHIASNCGRKFCNYCK